MQVVQNHQDRAKGTGHSPPPKDKNAVDLAILAGQRIEVQFDDMATTSLNDSSNIVCKMDAQRQYFIGYPKIFWENGYEWQHIGNNWEFGLAIGRAKDNDTSILYRSTRLGDRHTRLELINKNNHQILYTQDLLIQPFRNGCFYLPSAYSSEIESAFSLLQNNELPYRQRAAQMQAQSSFAETLDTACQWKLIRPNEYLFEGKKIRIMTDKALRPRFLCSKHYAAVAFMSRIGFTKTGYMEIMILNRETLESVGCRREFDSELNVEQRQQYQKGEFHLERIQIKERSSETQCLPVQFYFSDGTMQQGD